MKRKKNGMKPGAHILIEDVGHQYRGAEHPALVDVGIEIQPGEIVAMIGRSGCGKSTLLHIVSGLSRPTRGKVWIDGRVIDGPSPKWNVMFQTPSLYPWMSVFQNASLGLRFAGRMDDARTKVSSLLEMVQLSQHIDDNVQALSGGQQQRVALARSLATDPEALLLDEPFSALDAFTRASLQRDVRAIAKKLGITVVLVTHDIDEAVLMADRAVVMAANPGRVIAEVDIDLGDDRSRQDPRFKATRERLMNVFEQTAGPVNGGGDAATDDDEAEPALPRAAVVNGTA